MITKSYIEKTINELDKLYNSSPSQKKAIYYSKLAVLELCGWLEETMDDIVEKHCNRKLKNSSTKKYFKKNHIKKVYGFHYEDNFRKMLISTIGIIEVEKIEIELEKFGKISTIKATTESLKTSRNIAAHTFSKGATRKFDAPSITKGQFHLLLNILTEIDNKLRSM